MAAGTFTLLSGSKLRTGSARRFVVVAEHVAGNPFVEYRTDDLARAVNRAAKLSGSVVVDTVDRKVRVRDLDNLSGRYRWVDA
jgi:hypothetical protein